MDASVLDDTSTKFDVSWMDGASYMQDYYYGQSICTTWSYDACSLDSSPDDISLGDLSATATTSENVRGKLDPTSTNENVLTFMDDLEPKKPRGRDPSVVSIFNSDEDRVESLSDKNSILLDVLTMTLELPTTSSSNGHKPTKKRYLRPKGFLLRCRRAFRKLVCRMTVPFRKHTTHSIATSTESMTNTSCNGTIPEPWK
jgi:hypothetical protein